MTVMTRRQFPILYRDFLFGIVDRDLLSTHARGDASQLLLQVLTLLIFVSVGLCLPAFGMSHNASAASRAVFALNIEHFLVATTMLCTGVFSALSWGTMFPGRRDVMVLGPLPVRAHVILLARLVAAATALGLTIASLHVVAGVVWPLALDGPSPRLLAAYWITMAAAGAFVFGIAATAHGILSALVPRRYVLRISPVLQLGMFAAIVGGYFLQPMFVRPAILESTSDFAWQSSPSLWFLGLFRQLSGAGDLAPFGRVAWIALTLTGVGTAAAYGLSYFRVLQRIAEEPDAVPAAATDTRLPSFGDSRLTAVVHFSARTVSRSPQHRMILASYWGLGFAVAMVFLKSPGAARQQASVPVLVSTIVMMSLAVLGGRIAFAMPKDLHAHWIFRVLPAQSPLMYATARRRALILVSVVPASIVSTIVFAVLPWSQAIVHLAALVIFASTLVEIAVSGAPGIPCSRSYLPGRSRAHISIFVGIVVLLPLIVLAAAAEHEVLQHSLRSAAMLLGLLLAWFGVRQSVGVLGKSTSPTLEFEDAPADRAVTLELWDASSRAS
jgi:hypothetical protein